MSEAGIIELLTAENEADFFSRGRPLKAVLFSMLPTRFRVSSACEATHALCPIENSQEDRDAQAVAAPGG